MHGLNTYDYGARQYYAFLPTWDRIDPLCEKYYSISPYAYCANNPVNRIDPDGRDGVLVVNNNEKTLTIRAVYYVETGSRVSRNTGESKGYSTKDITHMNEKINGKLNGYNLTVSEGDYSGYSVLFDLSFKDGGNQQETMNLASNEYYEGNHIGNTFARWDDTLRRFRTIENPDGTTSTVGGVTEAKTNIVMNNTLDNMMNRIHEIFHTLGFDDFKLSDKGHGIMNYPPQKPDQKDVNNLVNNDFLPKIVIQ